MLRTLRAASGAVRGAAGGRSLSTVVLPDLPYDEGALAPVVSGEIMALHHSKHHAAYVANFNIALAQYAEAEAKGDVGRMIALQPALKFNGGGHVNHSIFWKNLCPPKVRLREPAVSDVPVLLVPRAPPFLPLLSSCGSRVPRTSCRPRGTCCATWRRTLGRWRRS